MDMSIDSSMASAKRERSPFRRNEMHNNNNNNNNRNDRDRDRHRRGDRPSRFQDRSPSSDRGRRAPAIARRVYISNIPYEFRWQDLKDLFRSEIGEVDFVELFDDGDKPRGCGVIEFAGTESVKKAIDKMHRFEVRGRKLVVKETPQDFEHEIAGRLMAGGSLGGRGNMRRDESSQLRNNTRWNENQQQQQRPSSPNDKGWGFTYGLSPAFLESLGIKSPLVNRVFVANLDYKVDEKKLEEVFKLAGKISTAELNKDKEGKSRGHGVVQYEHPVEAVQAISMLHHQMLYDRLLTVRMDRVNDKNEDKPPKLPDGLKGIGMGLGEGGKPLQDVSRSLPANLQNVQMQHMSLAALQNPGMAGIANQAALGGLPGMASMGSLGGSVGLGLGGAPGVGGMGGVMGGSLTGNLGGGLGPGLGGLGGSSALGGILGSLGQSAGDLGMGASGLGSLGSSLGGPGLGSSLGAGNLSGGMGVGSSFGNPGGNSVSNMGGNLGGQNSFGSGGMGQMTGPGSYMNPGGGNNAGFGMGNSSNAGSGDFGNRNFDMNAAYNNNMEDRDFRNIGFNKGGQNQECKMESDTVIIRNLSGAITWQMLRDKFREFGDVKFAEIRNKDTGFVRFSSSREAQRAVDVMDHTRIDGRIIRVDLC